MVTRLKYDGRVANQLAFKVYNRPAHLWITNFDDGYVTAEPATTWTIYEFSKVIEGCFHLKSNFKEEMKKIFGIDKSIKGIRCRINGVYICTATEEQFNKDWIVSQAKLHFNV